MKEYAVIAKGYYRQDQPEIFRVLAENEDEAKKYVWRTYNINKKILDVKNSDLIIWNDATIEEYWDMYK